MFIVYGQVSMVSYTIEILAFSLCVLTFAFIEADFKLFVE